MSDQDDPGTSPHEPVGSVGEEAAKLFGALSEWAREHDLAAQAEPDPDPGPDPGPAGTSFGESDVARAAARARAAFAAGLGDLGAQSSPSGPAERAGHDDGGHQHAHDEQHAHDPQDCRYCPICQVVQALRRTSPEVQAHLGAAAGSLMQAVAGLLATTPPRDAERPPAPRGPVERIDLDAENDADAHPAPGDRP